MDLFPSVDAEEEESDPAPMVDAEGTDDAPCVDAEETDDAPMVDAEETDDTPCVDAEETDDTPMVDAEGTDDAPCVDAEEEESDPAPMVDAEEEERPNPSAMIDLTGDDEPGEVLIQDIEEIEPSSIIDAEEEAFASFFENFLESEESGECAFENVEELGAPTPAIFISEEEDNIIDITDSREEETDGIEGEPYNILGPTESLVIDYVRELHGTDETDEVDNNKGGDDGTPYDVVDAKEGTVVDRLDDPTGDITDNVDDGATPMEVIPDGGDADHDVDERFYTEAVEEAWEGEENAENGEGEIFESETIWYDSKFLVGDGFLA